MKTFFRWIALMIFIIVLVAGVMFAGDGNLPGDIEDEEVLVTFIGTQNDADCILLKQGDNCILIDTGEEADTDTILHYLESKNIKKIQYMILTHPDKDHIGGALAILEKYDIGAVVQPYYPNKDDILDRIKHRIDASGIQSIYPTRTRRINLGSMQVLIYPPLEKEYQKVNNYSLAVMINHREVSMLFNGDAQKKRIKELLSIHWGKVNLLKVPYHGRWGENTEEFLESISPDIAVITSQSADGTVISSLEKNGTSIYYSVGNTLEFTSNGNDVVITEEDGNGTENNKD